MRAPRAAALACILKEFSVYLFFHYIYLMAGESMKSVGDMRK